MDNRCYYIGRLDELSELLRKIYYDLDDAIKLRNTIPLFENYRDELELKTAFLPFFKKDFPEHSSLIDTAKADIKDALDKLTNDKNYSLAASAAFATGQSVQALTAALINTKAERLEGQVAMKTQFGQIKGILESLKTLKKKKLDFVSFVQKSKIRYEAKNRDLEQRERFIKKKWDGDIKPAIDYISQQLDPLWGIITLNISEKYSIGTLKDMISCGYEMEAKDMETYMAALIEEFETVTERLRKSKQNEAGGGDAKTKAESMGKVSIFNTALSKKIAFNMAL
jgi:hypothetical protein